MSTNINASKTAGLVVTPDLSGNPKLQWDGIDAPVFSAYASATTSMANNAYTKIGFQTEEFDSGGFFDSVTNFRFQPTIAGYYQIIGSFSLSSSAPTVIVAIYKNGAAFKQGAAIIAATSIESQSNVSALVFLNGTTDYVELFGFQNSGGAINCSTGVAANYFQGALIRGA